MSRTQWRTVVIDGHQLPTYQVSDEGEIKTRSSGNLKTIYINRYGYYFTTLYLLKEFRERTGISNNEVGFYTVSIHRLVAESFLGPRPEGIQIHHVNGIKTDNRVKNLQYVTPSENVLASYRSGERTSQNGRRYLSDRTYAKIISLWETGFYSQVSLGKIFGLNNSTISKIVNGKSGGGGFTDLEPDPVLLERLRRKSPVMPGSWCCR